MSETSAEEMGSTAALPTASPTEILSDPTATSQPPPTEAAVNNIAEPAASATTEPKVPPLPGIELFTFVAEEPGWYTVDDNVMGGVSSSKVTVTDAGTLFFSGTMSLDNNGGFASVRSDWSLTNLSNADGILLRVLGDGQTYRLRLRSAETGSDIAYNAFFETTAETWQTVYIPFADMVPTRRGFVMDVGGLNAATIGSFGFMLSDKQPGEFGLLVDWIRAVTEAEIQESEGFTQN